MPLFQNAQFLASAHHLRDLPPATGVEVAFAGRSNAGKSSALNTLANHNRLAFVSKQPGRTQLINFFTLGNDRHLVDLPGYGYAKVPEALRAHWQQVLSTYLSERISLKGLVLVMDSRHPLTPLDRQMLDWFKPTGKPVHVLLTKSDKLSRNEANQTLMKVRKELETNWGNCTVQLFSSLKKQGVDEAEKVIGAWLFDFSKID
ncbi:MAG TPA: ribosome biogenesis GTP-binding protein YihA/YsxC [Methylophilus sp.]|nr:ribosome biogenesis GTP-binding protein YihA/YsxC [Methylophilus sp.]HQQ32735.1 ribosome biogenesis GTP-binding protein YihA/YsxC [Methylophilus sp.]